MNIKLVQYALALSKTLNFSQAATEMGISQPALSKQIQYLEKELGVKLFDRNHTPLTLTPAGEYFIRNAKELIYKEEQLRKSLSLFQSGESGRLVIGVTPFRSLYIMPELVKKIRTRYPGVCVSLKEVPAPQLRKEAEEGKYDFAIVNLPVDTSLLEVTPLEPDTLAVAVHKDLAEKLPEVNTQEYPTLDFREVAHLPFIVLSRGQELRQMFDKLCTAADCRPDIAAEVMGVTSARAMAQAGVGATLLPLQFVRGQNFDSNLSLYIVNNSPFSRQPVIVTRKGQFRTPYADYAINLLTGRE